MSAKKANQIVGVPPPDFLRKFPDCKGVKVYFEILTPELAVKYLALNTTNRTLKSKQVTKIVTSLTEDGPLFTGDALFFFEDGSLGEGQHRCHASIQTGISIPVLVLRGVPLATGAAQGTATPRDTRDRVRQRCQTEGLTIKNISDKSAMPGHIFKLQTMEPGMPWSRARWQKPYTNNQLADFVIENDKKLSLALSVTGRGEGKALLTPRGGMAAMAYHLLGIHKSAATMFFDKICTGEELVKGDPILAFRKYLLDQVKKVSSGGAKDAVHYRWAHAFVAWNAWLSGKTLTRISTYRTVKGEQERIPWPMPVKKPGSYRPWVK